MGVAATRRASPRASGVSRRISRVPGRSGRRAVPRRGDALTRVSYIGTISPRASDAPRTFWERLRDDRDLTRFKIVLLVSLFLLTAVLEWVA